MPLMTSLLGRRLANREAETRKIGVFEGVPAMGLDGLGSASYGPEAMLAVLAGAGAASLSAIGPITGAILALLTILYFSYRQTIVAYPTNGGSYTVARENLGTNAGLLAAAALMVDYMLNVAVGVSAGVGALTSAVPELHPFTLPLCLAILTAITLVNLRGTKESGLALALPTYLFIATLGLVLLAGAWAVYSSGGRPAPVVAPPPLAAGGESVTLWLMLRAFAAGCTAMTGVEAVSNGVNAFKNPSTHYARLTLTAIVLVLGMLLLGIAHLAQSYGVVAMDQTTPGYQSVVSQIVSAVLGRGWLYYVTIGSVLAVLCLSANTSFVGFPRLCRLVAQDGYLPKAFVIPGRRLVFTVGILFLAVGAGALLIAFDGITDRLIPLFAVGAFLSFTLSQAGMAMHWRRLKAARADHARLWINALGAVATGAALAIIVAAKFTEGAWLTIVVIPLALLLLKATHHYYARLDREILRGSRRAINLADHAAPIAIVPIERWDRKAKHAVHTAVRISPNVIALHLTKLDGPDATEHAGRLRRNWALFVEQPAREAGLATPRLVIESSPYRSVLAPLLRRIEALRSENPACTIVVVLSEFAGERWWEYALHTHRTWRLRRDLLRHGGKNIAVVIVPWELAPPEPDAVLAEEEPTAAEQEGAARALPSGRESARTSHGRAGRTGAAMSLPGAL